MISEKVFHFLSEPNLQDCGLFSIIKTGRRAAEIDQFSTLFRDFNTIGSDDFARLHEGPFLVGHIGFSNSDKQLQHAFHFPSKLSDVSNQCEYIENSFVLELKGTKEPNSETYLTIGRNKSCDIPILRSGVSELHAQLFTKFKDWYIADNASKNGTFVGTTQLKPPSKALLIDGEIIRIAGVTYAYLIERHHLVALFTMLQKHSRNIRAD